MKNSNIFEKLYLMLAAFTTTNVFVLTYLTENGQATLASMVSMYSLYTTTFLSCAYIVGNNSKIKSLIIVGSILYALVVYQHNIDIIGESKEYTSKFLIHGLGGFAIFLAIPNYEKYFKYITVLSIIYCVLLLFEPINHKLLHQSAMVTGYILASLVITIILSYYTICRNNKIILFLAIVLTIITAIFSSRGCGMSIIASWFFLYLWDMKNQGKTLSKFVKRVVICSVIGMIIVYFTLNNISSTAFVKDDGSLIEKLSDGYLYSDNGRNDIWAAAFGLLSTHWFTGIGMGGDRVLGEYVFSHNIFLEIALNFGIPLTLLMLGMYWILLTKAFKRETSYFMVAFLIAVCCKSWLPLLFSSSYLENMMTIMGPIGIAINVLGNKKKILKSFNNTTENSRVRVLDVL